jgi:hypothetical protein
LPAGRAGGEDAYPDRALTCAAGSGIAPVQAALAYRSTHVKPVAFSLRMFLVEVLRQAHMTESHRSTAIFALDASMARHAHWTCP